MVPQGPLPGRYGKCRRRTASSRAQAYIRQRRRPLRRFCLFDFVVNLSLPAGPGWRCVASFGETTGSLERRVVVRTTFNACDIHSTRPGKTENGKPRAQSEECAPVKTFLREAQTKTLERGGIPLFQPEERKSTRRPLFTVSSIPIRWWPLKSVGYVMLTERRNDACWENR